MRIFVTLKNWHEDCYRLAGMGIASRKSIYSTINTILVRCKYSIINTLWFGVSLDINMKNPPDSRWVLLSDLWRLRLRQRIPTESTFPLGVSVGNNQALVGELGKGKGNGRSPRHEATGLNRIHGFVNRNTSHGRLPESANGKESCVFNLLFRSIDGGGDGDRSRDVGFPLGKAHQQEHPHRNRIPHVLGGRNAQAVVIGLETLCLPLGLFEKLCLGRMGRIFHGIICLRRNRIDEITILIPLNLAIGFLTFF